MTRRPVAIGAERLRRERWLTVMLSVCALAGLGIGRWVLCTQPNGTDRLLGALLAGASAGGFWFLSTRGGCSNRSSSTNAG